VATDPRARRPDPGPAAEAVYRAARIRTGDPARPIATGLRVQGDRIVDVGDADALVAQAGAGAREVRLDGATIVPGFVDAHCHVSMLAYLLAGADCGPAAAPDIASILDRLAATPAGPDGWVTGSGYAEYQLTDARHPTRADLDAAVFATPCVLYHRSLHLCVVNSAALDALGLTDASPDPPRGWLGRDADGRLDGRLLESVMFDLMSANLRRTLDAMDAAARAELIRVAGAHLASLGITSCSDAAADAGAFMALREAERRAALPVRVTAMFTHPEAAWLLEAGMTTGFGSDRLRIGAIKLFADGGMSSRTAAVEEPYLVPPGDTGLLWYEPAELAAVIRACDDGGFQVAVHAQGERGIRTTLDAFRDVCGGGNPARHRIEHGGAFRSDLRELAADLGILVASQPGFISALGDGYLEALGPERCDYLYPYASLRDAGILVAGSSDAPVIDASPLLGMRDAVLRRTDGGDVIAPAEALTPSEALDLYTRDAAFASWSEAQVGALTTGRLADFVVLDGDPLEVDPEGVARLGVRVTVVGGQVVHGEVPAAVGEPAASAR
jgi:predicted amidohydrolase YtcJ